MSKPRKDYGSKVGVSQPSKVPPQVTFVSRLAVGATKRGDFLGLGPRQSHGLLAGRDSFLIQSHLLIGTREEPVSSGVIWLQFDSVPKL